MPLLGIAIVPVELAGSGLTPGDAISVAPIGIPVGETDEPDVMPSGEVAPIVGVGAAIPETCALATLQTKSAGTTAAINKDLIGILRLQTASPRQESIDDLERVFARPIVAASRLEAPCQRTWWG